MCEQRRPVRNLPTCPNSWFTGEIQWVICLPPSRWRFVRNLQNVREMPDRPVSEHFKWNSEHRTERGLLCLCRPTSTTPNPTLNPIWLAAQWRRWKECVRLCVWMCVCNSRGSPYPLPSFSSFSDEFFLLFIYFSNHWILDSVCFHIANQSIPQTWWNLCFRGLKGYFFLFLTQFL